MYRTQQNITAACCLAAFFFSGSVADAEKARGRDDNMKAPKVQRALQSLEEAKEYLVLADETVSSTSRRELRQASEATDSAIEQCKAALKSADADREAERGQADRTGRPLRGANQALARAVEELSASDSDYGGHRKKALSFAETAAAQVSELARSERGRSDDDRDDSRRRDRDDDRADRDGDRTDRDDRASGLPAAVRRTVRENVPDLEVREVKRDGEGGGEKGIVYKIEGYSDRDGKVEMRVAEDGELLKLERKGRGGDR